MIGPVSTSGREPDRPSARSMVEGRPAARQERVCAVVVTFNRQELLRRCLTALEEQRRPLDELLVVDNASTDGTSSMVAEEFPRAELLTLAENEGGAGGFHRGLAWAHARGHDWFWLMDDDTFAEPDSLEALLAGGQRAPGGHPPLVLASRVLWKDERLHPMNMPTARWRWRGRLAEGVGHGLLLLRNATFVSVAVRREAIDRFGLPLSHYFLWSDDVEFTSRILRDEPGYLVPESRVYHWTREPHTAVSASGDRFYYHVRNVLLLLRGTSLEWVERLDFGRYYVRTLREYVRTRRPRRAALALVARGLRDGLRGEVR